MSMITGVGDEVVEVTCVLLAAAVAALAWWSTAARPDRFRTVIVMERTTRGSPHNLTAALAGRNISAIRRHLMRGPPPVASAPAEPVTTDWREDADGSASESDVSGSDGSQVGSRESEAGADVEAGVGTEQAQEMDRIVSAMDADINALCSRRINFLTRPSGDTPADATAELPSTRKEEPSETQRDTNTSSDRSVSERCEGETHSAETDNKENTVSSDNTQKVNIKLKYLNDTFREVDGSMEELLKDFKWRHFATELSQQLRVLLIFNGHVLNEDASTLRACGLYHNCVVHCLVHPPRQARSPVARPAEVVPSLLEAAGAAGVAGLEAEAAAPAPPAAAAEARAWDLENVLMTLVSIILTIIWFFRCEYSNIFTASASGALFALTVFYSVAIFGLYFSDTFHLTNRPPREDPVAQRPQIPAYS